MKIICIGRNYAEHAAELHEQLNDSGKLPEEPMFFLKPDTALLRNNDPFYIPSFSQEVHYECELVVRINRVAVWNYQSNHRFLLYKPPPACLYQIH